MKISGLILSVFALSAAFALSGPVSAQDAHPAQSPAASGNSGTMGGGMNDMMGRMNRMMDRCDQMMQSMENKKKSPADHDK